MEKLIKLLNALLGGELFRLGNYITDGGGELEL